MRKLMWFVIGFTGACGVGVYCYAPWFSWLTVSVFVLAAVLLLITRWCPQIRIIATIALGISLGFLWFSVYDHFYLASARSLDECTQAAVITAEDFNYAGTYGSCFDGEIVLHGKSYRVRTYLHSFVSVQPGDEVSGDFTFRLTNGGDEGLDYYSGKGIFLLAYQDSDGIALSEGEAQVKHYPAILRSKLISIIEHSFPSDSAGFAKALLLGDRTGIDYKISTAFKLSGMSHIIAVSGLHVSILFGFIYLITARQRLLTALIGTPIVLLFAAVAGFSPSVLRASIMQILMMIAMLFDREYDPPTALSFAVLVMLVGNPLVITSISFQLSVSCMAGIFLFSERIRNWILDEKRLGKRKGKVTAWIAGSVSVTFGAMAFTTPLVALYFGTVSLISVISNLLVLWVITYIFYGVMLVCAVGFLSAKLAALIGIGVSALIRFVLLLADILAQIPLAAVYTKSIYIVIWLLFCYGLFLLFLVLKRRPIIPMLGVAIIGLCLAVTFSWIEPMLDECTVTVLDVGQGQCVLLQSEGKTFMVDCGGSYDEQTADIASETLLAQGISRLDGIILTHYDRDHVGGTEYLLSRIHADILFLPFAEDEKSIGIRLSQMGVSETVYVSEDLLLTYGNTNLQIFSPISYKSGNESSMCVLFQTENCDILITGDRNMETERILLERYALPKLEVLIVGHHGAKSATSEALLAQTVPEYAIISVGKDNPYGHPSDAVLNRLEKFGCRVFRTDQYGTIRFRR